MSVITLVRVTIISKGFHLFVILVMMSILCQLDLLFLDQLMGHVMLVELLPINH